MGVQVGHLDDPVANVLVVHGREREVTEMGEKSLAAVRLEVFERASGEVGLLVGQPRDPVPRKGDLGRPRLAYG